MLVIDRFEGEFAVCEDESGSMVNIPISRVPGGAKEGSVLTEKDGMFLLDTAATELRRKEISRLQNSLWE